MFLDEDIAVDLGTTYSVIASRHQSLPNFKRIPSQVARTTDTHQILAFGNEARSMMSAGRSDFEVLPPLQAGVISRLDLAEEFIAYLLNAIPRKSVRWNLNLFLCVPWGATAVELQSYLHCTDDPRTKVHLIREPFAAAIGCGLNVHSSQAATIMDIGGGTTEICTLAYGQVQASRSFRMAGNSIDDRIKQYFRRRHNLEIANSQAEEIKIKHLNAGGIGIDYAFRVAGASLEDQSPKAIEMRTSELSIVLEPFFERLEGQLKEHLNSLPVEFKRTLDERGIYLTGGGALIRGWKERLEVSLDLPVLMAPDPLYSVIKGMMRILDDRPSYQDVLRISQTVSGVV